MSKTTTPATGLTAGAAHLMLLSIAAIEGDTSIVFKADTAWDALVAFAANSTKLQPHVATYEKLRAQAQARIFKPVFEERERIKKALVAADPTLKEDEAHLRAVRMTQDRWSSLEPEFIEANEELRQRQLDVTLEKISRDTLKGFVDDKGNLRISISTMSQLAPMIAG
jgi:hypothetical protein